MTQKKTPLSPSTTNVGGPKQEMLNQPGLYKTLGSLIIKLLMSNLGISSKRSPLKLYELTRSSFFTLADDPEQVVYQLITLDGLYSVCEDALDNEFHFHVCTEVFPVRPFSTIINSKPFQAYAY